MQHCVLKACPCMHRSYSVPLLTSICLKRLMRRSEFHPNADLMVERRPRRIARSRSMQRDRFPAVDSRSGDQRMNTSSHHEHQRDVMDKAWT